MPGGSRIPVEKTRKVATKMTIKRTHKTDKSIDLHKCPDCEKGHYMIQEIVLLPNTYVALQLADGF